MIQFNELRISPDSKYLIIDVQISPLSYYKNVGLGNILVDTQKSFTPLGPSGKSVIEPIDCNGEKHYRGFISIDGIADNMFFVYVTTDGNSPSEDTPCDMKASQILGITYNKQLIYNNHINMIKNLGGCEPSKELIDYILQQKAFDLALKTGNYNEAIKYWELFFSDTRNFIKHKCGCNGIS